MKEQSLPIYWRSSIGDVDEVLKLVKRGVVTKAGESAGKRPIYKVEYGKSNIKHGKANLSSALGAHDVRFYADKTGDDYVPTLFLIGSVHGGEFEGTMALVNLIKIMETGTDYAGMEHPELLSLMEKIHLVLIPVANPDGRSRIPYRSVVGMTFDEFRYYDQGTWKGGELCGWPGCKSIHPIKEECEFLGGYFNDDGVNMMHEDFFGEISNESKILIDICRKEVPDLSIQLHGGTNCICTLLPTDFSTQDTLDKCIKLSSSVKAAFDEDGIPYRVVGAGSLHSAFGLKSAMHHVCGEPVLTYESNQGLLDCGAACLTHDEIYRSHMLLFGESAKYVLSTKEK